MSRYCGRCVWLVLGFFRVCSDSGDSEATNNRNRREAGGGVVLRSRFQAAPLCARSGLSNPLPSQGSFSLCSYSRQFNHLPVTAIQPELIVDDLRRPVESVGIVAELREVMKAQREMGGLLTSGQAAKVLGVNSGAINVWVRRGRLTGRDVLGVLMVSASEVLAMHRQRESDGVSVGGRGLKAASIRDMAEQAWRDIDPVGV